MGKDDWLAGWLDERKKRRSGQVWVGLLTPLTHSAGTARAPQVTWFIFLSRSPPFRATETETRRGGNGPPILQRHGQRTSGRLTLRFPQVSPKLYTSLRSHFPGTGTPLCADTVLGAGNPAATRQTGSRCSQGVCSQVHDYQRTESIKCCGAGTD